MPFKYSLESQSQSKISIGVKDISFPASEIEVLKKQSRIITHRVRDDAERFLKDDLVYAQQLDESFCFTVSEVKILNSIEESPYFKELTPGQAAYLKKFDRIAVLTLNKTEYERPYKLATIKAKYGDRIYERLRHDEVHRWRAITGLELIHLEPDQKELARILANWKLLPSKLKAISDAKAKQLFGVTNLQNYEIVKVERNISDDPVFKGIIAAYKSTFGFDLSNLRLISTLTPRYTNGHVAVFPIEQFGGCWTSAGVVYLNADLRPVIAFYKLQNTSTEDLKKTLLAHELAHDVWHNHANDKFKEFYLTRAKDEKFTTAYLEHVRPDHMKEETFCEYLAAIITGRKKK